MIFRPFYYYDRGCAAYVFGCGTLGQCAVVDPRIDDIDAYEAFATRRACRSLTISRSIPVTSPDRSVAPV